MDTSTIINYCLSILSIIAAFIFYFISRRRKHLSYLIDVNEVVRIDDAARGEKLQILYDGYPVKTLHIAEVTLTCSGNKEIRKEDYDTPVTISLFNIPVPANEHTDVTLDDLKNKISSLTVDLVTQTRSKPRILRVSTVDGQNLKPIITKGDTVITLNPTLLNPKESITFSILIDNYADSSLSIHGRIAGCEFIDDKKRTRRNSRIIMLIQPIISLVIATGVILLMSLTNLFSHIYYPLIYKVTMTMILITLGILILLKPRRG